MGAAVKIREGKEPGPGAGSSRALSGESQAAGDAAAAFQIFPGMTLEVILWLGDDEFPPQVFFTLPAHLDLFWHLDAIWGRLHLMVQELHQAAATA